MSKQYNIILKNYKFILTLKKLISYMRTFQKFAENNAKDRYESGQSKIIKIILDISIGNIFNLMHFKFSTVQDVSKGVLQNRRDHSTHQEKSRFGIEPRNESEGSVDS